MRTRKILRLRVRGIIIRGTESRDTHLYIHVVYTRPYVRTYGLVRSAAVGMGISRLTTFVNDEFARWRRVEGVSGHLVVDGNSLTHELHNMEWSNGGQYREFKCAVKRFYSKLLSSRITPIVIFDGVDEEEKSSVLVRRKQDWLDTIHARITDNASRELNCKGRILPPLCSEVYRMALHDLNIQFYVADGEADVVIARVANHFSCPVLSNDSDFFVFRLIGGYIPMLHFYWQSSVITAQVYHREEFATQLRFQSSSLLCAVPAIVGNDFISPCSSSSIGAMLNSMPNPGNTRNKQLSSICRYLSQFRSLEHFVSSSGRKTQCRKAEQWYEIPESLSCQKLVESTTLRRRDGSPFPQWLIRFFHLGRLPSAPLDAAINSKILFRMMPDNYHRESSVVAGQTLRRQIYSLLGCDEVVEIFRHGLVVSGVKVPGAVLPGGVTLESIECMTDRERQTLFYTFVGSDEQSMRQLNGKYHDWKFVAATAWLWVATTAPPEALVRALLLCFVLCSGSSDAELDSLRRTCRMPVAFRKSQRWLDAMHSFMQWQVIHLTTWALNELLMEPMLMFSPAYLYDGQVAMYFASADNIRHLVSSFSSYRTFDRTLHKCLEESVLAAQLPTTPLQPTQCAAKVPTSRVQHSIEVVDIVGNNGTTDIECLGQEKQASKNQPSSTSNETRAHPDSSGQACQISSGQQSKASQTQPPSSPRPGQTSVSTQPQPPSSSRPGPTSVLTQTQPPSSPRPGQTSVSTQTQPPSSSRPGQISVETQTQPPNISTQSKAESNIPRRKSKYTQTQPPRQQSRASQTSSQMKPKTPTQYLTTGATAGQSTTQKRKAKRYYSRQNNTKPSIASESQRQATENKISAKIPAPSLGDVCSLPPTSSVGGSFQTSTRTATEPQATAHTGTEKSDKKLASADKGSLQCVQTSGTAESNTSQSPAAETFHLNRTEPTGAQTQTQTGGKQVETQTGRKEENPKDQPGAGHAGQLSQQSGASVQGSAPQKKARKKRRPRRGRGAATPAGTPASPNNKQPQSHSQSPDNVTPDEAIPRAAAIPEPPPAQAHGVAPHTTQASQGLHGEKTERVTQEV